ncbi:MAG: NUDIX hydrolase [Acidimicrobiales bacterium]
MTGFRQLDETVVYEGAVVTLAQGRFLTPDGDTVERDCLRHPGAVSVVALRGDNVVMVRQYRAAIDQVLLEIPAGKRDVADEAPDVTANRELMEEVGYRASSLTLLSSFYNSAGFCDELSFVYLAEDLEPVPTDLQGVEEQHMTIVEVPLDSVPDLIASGELCDAKSIIGCLLALRHRGR